jgi:hypothetical protein
MCVCVCECHRLLVNEEIRAAAQIECLLIVRTSQIGLGFRVQGLGTCRVSVNRLNLADWFCPTGGRGLAERDREMREMREMRESK